MSFDLALLVLLAAAMHAAWNALDAGSVRVVSGQRLLALIRGAGPPETWLPRTDGAAADAA